MPYNNHDIQWDEEAKCNRCTWCLRWVAPGLVVPWYDVATGTPLYNVFCSFRLRPARASRLYARIRKMPDALRSPLISFLLDSSWYTSSCFVIRAPVCRAGQRWLSYLVAYEPR